MKIGTKVICTMTAILPGRDVAPPLTVHETYTIKEVYVCGCGQAHLDVGLKSKYNYISCQQCNKPLPNGDKIHWCHPTRFITGVLEASDEPKAKNIDIIST